MLYDASRTGNASEDIFRADWWRARAAVQPTPAGRGQAVFIADDRRSWVLRHYCRGGSVAKVLDDRYLWTGEERTRPFREWRLLVELRAAGLPVPVPIAAQYKRSGAFYRGDLITERIAGAKPLSALLAAAPLSAEAWEGIGACVRRFQDQGIFHADLNAHNILLDEGCRVFIVDFDRGERRPAGPWRDANVARLRRSIDKIRAAMPPDRFGEEHWRAFSSGHGAAPAGVAS